jgi:hypothetical protein
VTVAAAVAYLATAGLLTVIAVGHRGVQLVTGLPDAVAAPLLALIPGGLTFRAGWLARHTPRMVRR